MPKIPYHDTIIYEAHVKGLTKLHPSIPQEIQGTYAGIAHPEMIRYLQQLGITAIELMPVHHFVADRHLIEKGLTNYWGYNTLGFFAPDIGYASNRDDGNHVNEFKDMVKQLHAAGIEVILDVVYNHTAEGNHLGPTFCFKGIDNAAYYRLNDGDPHYYMDYTGTGQVKLIAEPWDINDDGYMVGKCPPGWAEWNDKYRDCVRDFWRGAESKLAEFSERFTGIPYLYQGGYRSPTASVNLITAHDGFTLHDLVSYNEKHNEANDEDNQDGTDYNHSWNCGVEGPMDDAEIVALRNKQKRNMLTTLFLSQGVPMLVAGDELGRSQGGNNNAYCQDNEISWINWGQADQQLIEFTKGLIWFCKNHPTFRRRRWFQGLPVKGSEIEDIRWYLPEGTLMSDENWEHDFAKSLGVYLNGNGIRCVNYDGQKIKDDSFYIIFNAHEQLLEYVLPPDKCGNAWRKAMISNTCSTVAAYCSVWVV